MMTPAGGSFIQTNMTDQNTLYSCYMPYIAGGGLFVPSRTKVKLGQQLLVIANIPGESQRYPIQGKVIWISPKQNGLKPQGFAIQFSGEKSALYRNEVERVLAGMLQTERPTYTM